MIRTVHILVTGRVQGVCYRASTQKKAQHLGIEGWVKNLPDGRVEILAQAESILIEQLIAWCHRGPSLANVTDVLVEELAPTDLPVAGFGVK